MKQKKQIHSIGHKISAVFMILTLLWLTVSITFVVSFNQAMAEEAATDYSSSPASSQEEEASNPFGNNSEEKAPSGNSLSEEYLHHQHLTHYHFLLSAQYHQSKNAAVYIAYHGELLVPPPNAV